jgi:hypothetical protein
VPVRGKELQIDLFRHGGFVDEFGQKITDPDEGARGEQCFPDEFAVYIGLVSAAEIVDTKAPVALEIDAGMLSGDHVGLERKLAGGSPTDHEMFDVEALGLEAALFVDIPQVGHETSLAVV